MKKTPSKNSPQNLNSLKKKLASRFLKKLNKISSSSASASASMVDKGKRRHAVRTAAYASMASAVGPRRAWSRALLKKIRSHRERKSRVTATAIRNPRNDEGILLEDLSEVVPGGEAMDSRSLLNETTHYIKCLRAQVQIMTQILHYSSSSISNQE